MKIFRRRRFVINRSLQYSLFFISLLYVILFLAIVGASLFIPLMVELGKTEEFSEKSLQAANLILYLHSNFWPAVLFSLIFIGLHSIRTSHKIAGPFYRLNFVFRAMKEGNLPKPIQLRKSDYFLPEIELFNQMIEKFRGKVTEIQGLQAELSEAISECSEVTSHASKEEIIEHINNITEKGNQLAYKVRYFKIES
jgi:methyl-accepting chemotaxis protein